MPWCPRMQSCARCFLLFVTAQRMLQNFKFKRNMTAINSTTQALPPTNWKVNPCLSPSPLVPATGAWFLACDS